MEDNDYLCPVCEKHYFDSIDDFDTCPVCGWEVNIPQLADHDLADGRNALSVNEQRVQYAAMKNPATREPACALKKDFMKERWNIKELMREFATGSTADDFELALPAFEAGRQTYITALKSLLESAKCVR